MLLDIQPLKIGWGLNGYPLEKNIPNIKHSNVIPILCM